MIKLLLLFVGAIFVFGGSGCHRAILRSANLSIPPAAVRRLEEAVFFGFDDWRLPADQQEAVTRKAEALKKHKNLSVILEGHTDRIGPAEYNLQLGDRRARKVKLELVRRGVLPGRLSVVSFGETRPRDPGRSAAALRANRRVEFRLR